MASHDLPDLHALDSLSDSVVVRSLFYHTSSGINNPQAHTLPLLSQNKTSLHCQIRENSDSSSDSWQPGCRLVRDGNRHHKAKSILTHKHIDCS